MHCLVPLAAGKKAFEIKKIAKKKERDRLNKAIFFQLSLL